MTQNSQIRMRVENVEMGESERIQPIETRTMKGDQRLEGYDVKSIERPERSMGTNVIRSS